MTRALVLALAVAAALLVAGCGQKRDLVLPDAPPPIDERKDTSEAAQD
jgi:predicted small lipoprotein YifL